MIPEDLSHVKTYARSVSGVDDFKPLRNLIEQRYDLQAASLALSAAWYQAGIAGLSESCERLLAIPDDILGSLGLVVRDAAIKYLVYSVNELHDVDAAKVLSNLKIPPDELDEILGDVHLDVNFQVLEGTWSSVVESYLSQQIGRQMIENGPSLARSIWFLKQFVVDGEHRELIRTVFNDVRLSVASRLVAAIVLVQWSREAVDPEFIEQTLFVSDEFTAIRFLNMIADLSQLLVDGSFFEPLSRKVRDFVSDEIVNEVREDLMKTSGGGGDRLNDFS